MKNSLKILIFSILTLVIMGGFSIAHAQIDVSNIEVFDIEDQRARIKWSTYNVPTKGIVYYGLDYQGLDHNIGYGSYSYSHESVMTGLQADEIYYYRIVVIDNLGETFETYIGSFSTEDMIDTNYPDILEVDILQTTYDQAVVYWRVDEDVKATVHYGVDREDLDKSKRVSRWSTEYDLTLTRLLPYRNYYLQIEFEDKAGNIKRSSIKSFNTSSNITKSTELEISNIQPLGYHEHLVFADQVLIKFQTNLLANSRVYYGTEPDRLRKSIRTETMPRIKEHRVVINELEPETTYYYMIKVYDSLYSKRTESQVYSFVTASLNYTTAIPTQLPVDTDGDGLYDDYEMEIGTDPLDNDSDRDGYGDGTEVSHGYNPLGPGKAGNGNFAYNKARISNSIEADHANYLRGELEKRLGSLDIAVTHWYKLLNSYIYGDYPVQAIAQAIKYGGKTVHPTISWSQWQNSADYQEYINK
ncbi:fibronectin type III domain-containing protein [Patescibacteria group bacterium]|nr:fibronectin type III domain-containing protein [Patescibacteria group bacterium]